jgi:hypothetical protein
MSVERQVRILMRAWPLPDRTERGDEIVGTTLDLVPDGASRVPAGLALNLVVGGLLARWHLRPPLWRWTYYRLGGRLPSRWHRWVLNDLTSPGWRRRIVTSQLMIGLVAAMLGIVGVQIAMHQRSPTPYFLLVTFLIGFGVGTLSMSRRNRDRQLARYEYGRPAPNDSPWPPPTTSG